MMNIVVLVTNIVLLFFSSNVEAQPLEENLQGCVAPGTDVSEIEDFFPDKVSPSHSTTWNVSYHSTYKILTNIVAGESYLLYQCGTEPPQDEIDTGRFKVITPVPLPDGVAVTSTVQIPMFELLGVRNEIRTYFGDGQYITSPCLLAGIADGTVEIFDDSILEGVDPYDNATAAETAQTAYALEWQSLHPDRIIVDNNFMTSAGYGSDKTMTENGYLEGPSPARFEWIKLYSTLFNLEAEANRIADETEGRYNCTTSNAHSMVTADDSPESITAVWAYWSDYPGWEGWRIGSCEPRYNFYCDYSARCGINLLNHSGSMNHTEFEAFASDADIWFYSGDSWDDRYERFGDMLNNFRSVRNMQVYDHEGSGDGTWYEQRMAEYDVVLEDFCAIANRTTDIIPHERHYMRNVFTESIGQMGLDLTCTDRNAPMVSRATSCSPVVEEMLTMSEADSTETDTDQDEAEIAQLEENLQGCVAPGTNIDGIEDFFPDKVSPTHSTTWNVSYHSTYKILTNIVAGESYLLYQCGTEPPQDEIDTGRFKVITPVPLPDGVAVTSTVQIPMFELLGVRNEIRTYFGDGQYITSPCLLAGIADGTVEIFDDSILEGVDPYDNATAAETAQTAYALEWQSLHPDRIIVDNNFMTSAGYGSDKTMTENGYLEGPSPARFEWIKLYSTLFNLEAEANRIADETEGRYNCTTSNAHSMVTADDSPESITAVWAYWSDYPGWEGWRIGSCEPRYNFYCDYSARCGINLLNHSGSMNHTEFEAFASDADIWFYSGDSWDDRYERFGDMLNNFRSVRNMQVYDHEGSGDGTWYEQRMAEYDVVLEDFCAIANRTTDIIPHERHYMRNVFTESIGQMGLDLTCTDRNAPMVSRATSCSPMVEEMLSMSEADSTETDTDQDEAETAQNGPETTEDEPDTDGDEPDTTEEEPDTDSDEPDTDEADTAEEETAEAESSSSRASLVGAQFCALLFAFHIFTL